MKAAQFGRVDVVTFLSQYELRILDSDGRYVLYYVCVNNHPTGDVILIQKANLVDLCTLNIAAEG